MTEENKKWTHKIIKKAPFAIRSAMLNLYRQKPLERHTQNVSIHCCESWQKLICECSRSFCFFFWTLGGGWVKQVNGKLFFVGALRTQKWRSNWKIIKRMGEVGLLLLYNSVQVHEQNFWSTQLWFMEKKKEKEWELNSTNRGKRWGGHNCWDCCVGGARTLVGSNGLGASLSLSLAFFFLFFFREALAKKAITS